MTAISFRRSWTTLRLGIPEELDALIPFTFDHPPGTLMGQKVANLGLQYDFPVHHGILDYHGEK
ncbi:hypothetical protein EV401DRAFT_2080074 [Pisolithus croceorrhizus]|nr:hypothetical protein EV401DRAFT_2080074 [Pisolithus croceorrhizus]